MEGLRGRLLLPALRSAFRARPPHPPPRRPFSTSAEAAATKPGEIGEVSGVPEKHRRRRVVIYSPCRTAMQQGSSQTGKWTINFLCTEKWDNPLMGWTSTGDPLSHIGNAALVFNTKEEALNFARNYGWEYTVKEPHRPILKSKSYAENFKYKGPPPTED